MKSQTHSHAVSNLIPGDIPAAVSELGVNLARSDRGEATGWCIAHEERTGKRDRKPSWTINLETGLFICFSCDWRGNFNHLVQYALHLKADEANAWILKRGPIELVRKRFNEDDPNSLEDEITEADLALFTQVPEETCASRDLDPDAVDFYGILWDPDRELWICPVRHPFNDRLLGWQEKGGTPENKRHFKNHPKGLHKSSTLFGIDVYTGEEMIAVESPLDCPRILTAGLPGAVATMGAVVSDAQIDLMTARSRRVISAMDNDSAGDKANANLQKMLRGRTSLKFWDYSSNWDCKDPGDQTDEEIWASYEQAIPSVLARF